jgi:hypothetical protein
MKFPAVRERKMEPDRQSAVADHQAGEGLGRAWHDAEVARAGGGAVLGCEGISHLDSELKEITDWRRRTLSDGAAMDAATHA